MVPKISSGFRYAPPLPVHRQARRALEDRETGQRTALVADEGDEAAALRDRCLADVPVAPAPAPPLDEPLPSPSVRPSRAGPAEGREGGGGVPPVGCPRIGRNRWGFTGGLVGCCSCEWSGFPSPPPPAVGPAVPLRRRGPHRRLLEVCGGRPALAVGGRSGYARVPRGPVHCLRDSIPVDECSLEVAPFLATSMEVGGRRGVSPGRSLTMQFDCTSLVSVNVLILYEPQVVAPSSPSPQGGDRPTSRAAGAVGAAGADTPSRPSDTTVLFLAKHSTLHSAFWVGRISAVRVSTAPPFLPAIRPRCQRSSEGVRPPLRGAAGGVGAGRRPAGGGGSPGGVAPGARHPGRQAGWSRGVCVRESGADHEPLGYPH